MNLSFRKIVAPAVALATIAAPNVSVVQESVLFRIRCLKKLSLPHLSLLEIVKIWKCFIWCFDCEWLFPFNLGP